MRVDKLTRKAKCLAKLDCENVAQFRLSFDKVSVPVCEECACTLYKALGAYFVPKSIKNKFNLQS